MEKNQKVTSFFPFASIPSEAGGLNANIRGSFSSYIQELQNERRITQIGQPHEELSCAKSTQVAPKINPSSHKNDVLTKWMRVSFANAGFFE